MSIDAMKQALEALEWEAEGWQNVPTITREAIAVLRERLAQPNKFEPDWDQVEALQESLREHMSEIWRLRSVIEQAQDPVAWMHNLIEGNVITHRPADIDRHPERWTALYTAPPRREWQWLTEEEIRNATQAMDAEPLAEGWSELVKFARSIEFKLRKKNT